MGSPNIVELIGHYGSDLTHAQSAWTSTSRDLNEEKLQRVGKVPRRHIVKSYWKYQKCY